MAHCGGVRTPSKVVSAKRRLLLGFIMCEA
jgi:hypothetical protein